MARLGTGWRALGVGVGRRGRGGVAGPLGRPAGSGGWLAPAATTRSRDARRPSSSGSRPSTSVGALRPLGQHVPAHRQPPQLPHRPPGRGLYGPSGSRSPVCSNRSSRLSSPSTSAGPPGRAGAAPTSVVLVPDLADQLLDQVLEGDDPVRPAVLVLDDRQVAPSRRISDSAESTSSSRAAASRRGRARRQWPPGRPARPDRAGRGCARSRPHRRSRARRPGSASAAPPGRSGPPRHGGADLEEVDLGPRHHHLAHLPVAGVEYVVDQLALVGRQRLVRGDQPAQLLLGDRLPVGRGSPPTSRTTRSVVRDSSQITGRASVAIRSSGRRRPAPPPRSAAAPAVSAPARRAPATRTR